MSAPNPPAFPQPRFDGFGHAADPVEYPAEHPGMTLRDWFAGQALTGLCSNPNLMDAQLGDDIFNGIRGGRLLVEVAGMLADAMLAERAKS